jgi:hypothetical protein
VAAKAKEVAIINTERDTISMEKETTIRGRDTDKGRREIITLRPAHTQAVTGLLTVPLIVVVVDMAVDMDIAKRPLWT